VPSLNAHILQLNAWIRSYGRFAHVAVADYYPALSDAAGNFRASLNSDGVHPNAAGYRVMEPIAAAAIAAATRGTAPRRPARLAPAREAGGYDAQ